MMVENSGEEKKSGATKILKEASAIIFWLYVTLKLAVFDLDQYLIEMYAPTLKDIITYKFFIFLGCVCLLWSLVGKKKFPGFVLYVLAYPFIVIGWKIPKLLFKNWSIAIIIAPAAFYIATTFRLFFISYALIILSSAYISIAHEKYGILLAMLILLCLLTLHLWTSIRHAYKSTVFYRMSKGISSFRSKMGEPSFLENLLKNSSQASKTEAENGDVKPNLSVFYMMNCAVEILNENVREVMRSRKMDMYLIISWLWTVLLTSIVFSFEYYALYKLSPSSFMAQFKPTYLSFLGFSFGKLTPSSVSTIAPADVFATALCYTELASSLVVVVILVFTILTAARERYKEDIENITKELCLVAEVFENRSQQLFRLAISDIETVLLNDNRGLVNGLRKLRGMPEIPPQVEEKAINTF